MKLVSSLHQLSNASLLSEIVQLAASERGATVELIVAIAEVDARRLYLGESCASMFVYCTRVLHLSEHAAYDRIEAARLARRLPVVLEQLASGSLTLTNLRLLAPHLTTANVEALTKEAAHKSKHEVEQLIARLRPQPIVPSAIRKLPEQPRPSTLMADEGVQAAVPAAASLSLPVSPPPRPAVVQPLAPERYKVQFTVSSDTREKLRRIQDLMRHTVPNGDLTVIFDRALSLLLENLEKRKVAATEHPRRARAGRVGDAPTSDHAAGVPRPALSSFIMWRHTRPAVAPT